MPILKMRKNVFETNSSSAHSLTLSDKLNEDQSKWVIPEYIKNYATLGYPFYFNIQNAELDPGYLFEFFYSMEFKLDYLIRSIIEQKFKVDQAGECRKVDLICRELLKLEVCSAYLNLAYIHNQYFEEIDKVLKEDDGKTPVEDYSDVKGGASLLWKIAFEIYLNDHIPEVNKVKDVFRDATGVQLLFTTNEAAWNITASDMTGRSKMEKILESSIGDWLFNPSCSVYIS